MFAVIVVGLSSGVNLYKLEQYTEGSQGRWVDRPGVEKQHDDQEWQPPVLNNETWTLEIYRSIVGTIQGIAWALLVFFLVSLVAFVIVRGQESQGEDVTHAWDFLTVFGSHRGSRYISAFLFSIVYFSSLHITPLF